MTGIPLKDDEEEVHVETPLATATNAISSFSSKIHGRAAMNSLPKKHFAQPAMVYELGDSNLELIPATKSMKIPKQGNRRDILIDF